MAVSRFGPRMRPCVICECLPQGITNFGQDLVEQRDQRVAVLHPPGLGVVARVGSQLRPLQRRAAPLPQRVVGDAEGDVGVGRRVNTSYGTIEGWALPRRVGALAGREVDPRLVRQQRRHHVQHGDLDLLAAPRLRAGRSASTTPWAADMPATRSAIELPTLTGGPSGNPVMSMTPDSACTTRS